MPPIIPPALAARKSPLIPCAFLFDNSAKGVKEPQLAYFTKAVLTALSAADTRGMSYCQLRVGLPMLPKLAERTTAVQGGQSGAGHTISHVVETYKFLIWDWLDSLSGNWCTIDPEAGTTIFRRHTGECVTLTSVEGQIAGDIDRRLRAAPGYIGAFIIDAGNPIHRSSFCDALIYAAAISAGAVLQELSYEGDPDWPVEGGVAFKPGGLIWKPHFWLGEFGPPDLPSGPQSARGAQSAEALAKKHAGSIEHRVLASIRHAFWPRSPGRKFSFESVAAQIDVLEAIMPDGKFTQYLFNPAHDKGGPKSKFFIEKLGIDAEDWRFLAAQFYEGLQLATPEDLRLQEWDTGYGMRFNVTMHVQGRSGMTGVMTTGWMLRPGQLPSLLTAIPADSERQAIRTNVPPVLPPGANQDANWEQLWAWSRAAGDQAQQQIVPTPLFLEGYPPVAEGEYGYGVVELDTDAHAFAKWLVRSGAGTRQTSGKVAVRSPTSTHSLDRGTAWARSAARVLQLNGFRVAVSQCAI